MDNKRSYSRLLWAIGMGSGILSTLILIRGLSGIYMVLGLLNYRGTSTLYSGTQPIMISDFITAAKNVNRVSESASVLTKTQRRKNTLEEKRRMRNDRIRRKRQLRSMACDILKAEVAESKKAQEKSDAQSILHRNMARTYWDRWHHELDERKSSMSRETEYLFRLRHSMKMPQSDDTKTTHLPIIDRNMLTNPSSLGETPSDKDVFVGRGSFGVVKYQEFRGINVAVKEFLPHTIAADVQREGQVLSKLCHPYLPLFFGIATDKYLSCNIMELTVNA